MRPVPERIRQDQLASGVHWVVGGAHAHCAICGQKVRPLPLPQPYPPPLCARLEFSARVFRICSEHLRVMAAEAGWRLATRLKQLEIMPKVKLVFT